MHKLNVIINATGYTDVDKTEVDRRNIFAINSEAVKIITEKASILNAWLIYYSTEYVLMVLKILLAHKMILPTL